MRSFLWRDYFTQEEFDKFFDDTAMQDKILNLIKSDLDTV